MPYPTTAADAAVVINALREYRSRARAIDAAISANVQLSQAELHDLQSQLSKLKDDLEADYRLCNRINSKSQLTMIQENCFCPAVTDMYVHFNARRGSLPYNDHWTSSLSDVIGYANHWLGSLEEQFPDI